MKTGKRITGDEGEALSCEYLSGLGQSVIERNWTSGHLEIDIITLDSKGLHFVEVKSRNAPLSADPLSNYTFEKRGRLVSAAKAYLRENSRAVPDEVFFDLVTVVFSPDDGPVIEYYPEAFIPIYV